MKSRNSAARSLFRDSSLILLGRYSQYLITVVSIPVSARLLGVERLGALAVGTGAYFFGSIAIDWGLTQVLASRVARNQHSIRQISSRYTRLRGILLIPISVVIAILLLQPTQVRAALAAGLAAGAASSLGEDWALIGTRHFGSLAIAQLTGRAVFLVAFVPALWLYPYAATMLIVLTASNLVTAVITRARSNVFSARDSPSPSASSPALFRLGAPVAFAKFLTTTYGMSSSVLLSSVVPPRQLGLFASSDRLIRAGQSSLEAIWIALLPRLSAVASKTSAKTARNELLRTVTAVGLSSLFLAAVVAVSAPAVINLIFGAEFLGAVPFLRIQAMMIPAIAVSGLILNAYFYVFEDRLGIVLASLCGVTTIVAMLVVTFRLKVPYAPAVSVVSTEWVVALFCLLRARRLVRKRQRVGLP